MRKSVIVVSSSPDSDTTDTASPSLRVLGNVSKSELPRFGSTPNKKSHAPAVSMSSAPSESSTVVKPKIIANTKATRTVKRRRLVEKRVSEESASDPGSSSCCSDDEHISAVQSESFEEDETSDTASDQLHLPSTRKRKLLQTRPVKCITETDETTMSDGELDDLQVSWIAPSQFLVQGENDWKQIEQTEESANEVMTIYSKSPWLRFGSPHPDPLAESQSLSSVRFPIISDNLTLRIPMFVADSGRLSNPQLETLIHAVNSFSRSTPSGHAQGFFLGEGTGCGKGRIISSSIWHLWNSGYRRHLWMSVSNDLMLDAIRDLRDLGASHIPVIELGSLKLCDLDSPQGEAECQQRAAKFGWKWHGEGIIWATYTLLARSMNQYKKKNTSPCASRMDQVLLWMNRSPTKSRTGNETNPNCKNQPKPLRFAYSFMPERFFNGGLVAMDEAHKAKNLFTQGANSMKAGSSAAGLMSAVIQEELKRCPVLYASATGATELKHMAYLSRLGLWGDNSDFANFSDFRSKVEFGGVAALECVAMDLKAYGLYSCRTLSFCNIKFNSATVTSNDKFVVMYDKTARLMQRLLVLLDQLIDDSAVMWNGTQPTTKAAAPSSLAAAQSSVFPSLFDNDLPSLESLPSFFAPSKSSRGRSSQQGSLRRSQFWATSQRLFKQLLVCQKVSHAVELAMSEVKAGKQVVISLWGTGEARTTDKMKELKKQHKGDEDGDDALELDDFLSPPRLMLEKLIDERFPYKNHRGEIIERYKMELDDIRKALELCDLPCNPLDELIESLGGPKCVAEMSGRMNRLVTVAKRVRYVSRTTGLESHTSSDSGNNALNSVNVQEQQLFQSGVKKFAVITEAASSGISLHCDRNLASPAPRTMICIELPWAADKAIQQFGRIHRSNQLYAPAYHLLVTDVGGERRFVAAIARRMKTLGAITRGDRRAAFASRSSPASGDGADNAGANSAEGPLLGFDIYSRWGYQSKTYLFRFLREAPEDSRYVSVEGFSPPPAVQRRQYTSQSFAITVVAELQKAGFASDELTNGKTVVNKSEQHEKGMDRFLNRLMMTRLKIQNEVFEFFLQLHDELVEMARHNGDLDRGVENLNSSFGHHVSVSVGEPEVLWRDVVTQVPTKYFRVTVDRGMSWSNVFQLWSQRRLDEDRMAYEGMYTFTSRLYQRPQVACVLKYKTVSKVRQTIKIARPAAGVSQLFGGQVATIEALNKAGWSKMEDASFAEVEGFWTEQYEMSLTMCIHEQQRDKCTRVGCKLGRRLHDEHLITGNILHIWYRLEKWLFSCGTEELVDSDDVQTTKGPTVGFENEPTYLSKSPPKKKQSVVEPLSTHEAPKRRLRLVKAQTKDGSSFVGVRIPEEKVDLIKGNLMASQRNAASRASAVASGRVRAFEPATFRRLCGRLVGLLAAKKYDTEVLSLEILYRLFVSEGSECEDSEILRAAFPPDEEGLDAFKSFMVIFCECNVGCRLASQSEDSHAFAVSQAVFKVHQNSRHFSENAEKLCRSSRNKYESETRYFGKSLQNVGTMVDDDGSRDAIALLMQLASSGLLGREDVPIIDLDED